MLKFGILGCGGISDRFCGVLNREENVAIHAVAARQPDQAARFAKKHGAGRSCGYGELLQDSSVDIIYIGTVHNRHYEQIKLCLEHGKHVLCEKPMVLHGAQARECFELAKRKKLLLMEGMWTRCNPCVMKAAEWVRAGKIGDVKLVTANFCFHAPYDPEGRLYNPDLAGGALYDVGVYVIEFATGILGENPVRASGIAKRTDTGVDGFTGITLDFPGGAIASLNCGFTAKTPHDAAIYGTAGSIEIKDFWRAHDAVLFDANGERVESIHEEFEDGFSYEIRHVVELMERGALESDLIPPADTIACADLFDRLLGTSLPR